MDCPGAEPRPRFAIMPASGTRTGVTNNGSVLDTGFQPHRLTGAEQRRAAHDGGYATGVGSLVVTRVRTMALSPRSA